MAAAVPLAAGQSSYKALSQLELARGVIASHLMDMRTNISLVKEKSPTLAAEFDRLRDELDTPPQPYESESSTYSSRVSRRTKAEDELNDVIAKIQELEGLSNFLGPPTGDELQVATVRGPIVVVNVSAYRCDAFLLVKEKKPIQVVPLTITEDDVVRMSKKLGTAPGAMKEVLQWLWENISKPIMTELGFTAPPMNDNN